MSRTSILLLTLLLAVGCARAPEPAPSPTRSPVAVLPPPLPPPTPEPEVPDVGELLDKGIALATSKQYDQAIPILEEAETLAPGELKVHQWLFICYKATEPEPGRDTRAYRHAQKVAELAGGSLQARQAKEYLEMVKQMPQTGPAKPGKPPADVKGWEKATWGMTRDQIQAAYQGTLKQIDVGDYYWYYEQNEFDLQTRRILAGQPFTVVFHIGDVTATLRAIYFKAERDSTNQDFQAVEKFLTERYGTPRPEGSKTRSWRFPTTTIRLTRSYGDIVVLYEPTGSR